MYLEHNTSKLIYRNPLGAVAVNTRLCLRVLVESLSIPQRVECVLGTTSVKMSFAYEIHNSRVYECTVEAPQTSGVLFYYFRVVSDEIEMFCGGNNRQLAGQGEMYYKKPENLFQITVFEAGYKTPDWMKNAVIYQIFPDRFYRYGDTPFHGPAHAWKDEPFYMGSQFGGAYLSNDFFGGTLEGITKKLPYLYDLGVTAIYLNPIFKAFSNHRYDTSDYENIDETLGTNEDFRKLCEGAHKLGVRIILDGVFSHTGADSKYFNKLGSFDSLGAYQSKQSPYFSWYSFESFHDKYDAWWGFETLPNVNELDDSFLRYIVEGENSIIKKWIRLGADGWRLDVADELPDEFIERLRTALKREKDDALLLGEVWEDASNKVSYGKMRSFLHGKSLDGVMNYVFRSAVLDFLLKNDASLFALQIDTLINNYPKEALYSCMNLISSHDVPRAMTVLSGAPDFRTMTRKKQHDYKIPSEVLFLAEKRMRLAIVMQMTMMGAPSIYYGDEIGMTGFADPFNRATFDWDAVGCELYSHTKRFANLRKNNACLKTGNYEMLYYYGGVICYMRSIINGKDAFGNRCTDGSIMVVINALQKNEYIKLCLDRFNVVSATDLESGQVTAHNNAFEFQLAPLSYKVLSLERNNPRCIKIQHIQ